MASDETLMGLVQLALKNLRLSYGHQDTTLSPEILSALSENVNGMTDIYGMIEHYREYNEVVFRSITKDQNKILARHIHDNRKSTVKKNGLIFIAMRLGQDETPDMLVVNKKFHHILVAII
jgi:hypothetical protein